MVKNPEDYPFSNYAQYAFGEANKRFALHASYLALATSPTLRQKRFRELIQISQETWAHKKWPGASGTHGAGRNAQQKSFNEFISHAHQWLLQHP
jgi:hypothetical protein